MPTFRFPTRTESGNIYSGMPTELRSYFERGFRALAKLPSKSYMELARTVMNSFESRGGGSEESGVADRLGVSPNDAGPLLAAASSIVLSLTSSDVSPQQIIALAANEKLLGEGEKAGAVAFAAFLEGDRARLKQSLERAELSAEVLPSLDEFEMAIDLRIKYDGQKISAVIPVLIAYIDTDATGQRLWLQMSKPQVEKLIRDLQARLTEIQIAENWLSTKSS